MDKQDDESNPDLNNEVIQLQSEIDRLTTAAEAAGEEGDIDKAQVIFGFSLMTVIFLECIL